MTRDFDGENITLFLCGDCMLGRGIDQILPHPGNPILHEGYVKDARTYVELAEAVSGRIPAPVEVAYVWGDAIPMLARFAPRARIVNLETAVTVSDDAWQKGINYRMHPQNIGCLRAADIDCCNLANNHVLDWGTAGLTETLGVLRHAGIASCGAGMQREEAETAAVLELGGSRLLVYGFGVMSSGIPIEWRAREHHPGVNVLADLSEAALGRIATACKATKRAGDLAIASIHWGGNWGFGVPASHRRFAHALIDDAGIDLVHGHSSHHVLGFEVYHGKLILYGCGDFINDYEGIEGYEEFRGDLALMYFPSLQPGTGKLQQMALVPMRIRGFRLHRAGAKDTRWLQETLNREGSVLGSEVVIGRDEILFWRQLAGVG